MDALIEFLTRFLRNLQYGILPNLGYWNYLILAFFVMIEGLVSILLGAAAASAGILELPLVIIAACCGNLASDILWYRLGYAGNMKWISRLTKKFQKHARLAAYFKKGMDKHAWKILLLAKFSGGLAIPTLITAGWARVPLKKWLPIVFIGETIKSCILALIGFYTAEAVTQIARDIRYVMILGTVVILIGLMFWLRNSFKNNLIYKSYFNSQEN